MNIWFCIAVDKENPSSGFKAGIFQSNNPMSQCLIKFRATFIINLVFGESDLSG